MTGTNSGSGLGPWSPASGHVADLLPLCPSAGASPPGLRQRRLGTAVGAGGVWGRRALFSLPLFVRWNWAESPPSAHSGKGGEDSLQILRAVEGGSHSTAAGCSPPGERGSFGPSVLKMERGHIASQTTCQGSGWKTGSLAHGIAGTRFQRARSHTHTHTHTHAHTRTHGK